MPHSQMGPEAKISLLEADPDLGRFLEDEERLQAARIALPVYRLTNDTESDTLFDAGHVFGALIIDGMMMHRIQVGEQPTLRLLGPGDLLSIAGSRPRILSSSGYSVLGEAHVALLDHRVLVAGQHWPRVFAALHLKSAEQADRIGVQLAICQLPRVTDRLLALMWLLAESWGRVTATGVTLPLALTHDALGGMIGARRPTVTLAIGELAGRGSIVKQDRGWLLLEQLSPPASSSAKPEHNVVFESDTSVWRAATSEAPGPARTHAELLESLARLREEHDENRERVHQRLDELRRTRDRVRQRRARLATASRRQAPSS